MVRLYDSLSGTVRELRLRDPGRVSIYVCGPTVYDFPHLGHGRFTLVWDALRRWLSYTGLEVTYVSNITDIDDNIIARANRDGRTEAEVAGEYEDHWWKAMAAIGVARPTHTPHATEFVAAMVETISSLILRNIAYRTSDGVYFDVSRVADYGLLAGQPLESLRAGARVEMVLEKRSPLDFAVWKNAKPGEPSWPAPFGDGRPGWHTECVVMSLDLLGPGFDLHCGGMDLRFPHHENERAQASALDLPFAQHWAHNGWVMVGGDKMSKSLGNFTSLTDMLAQTDSRAYRLLVLRSHYRSPIEVTPTTVADAERSLERFDAMARRFDVPVHRSENFARSRELNWSEETLALLDRVGALLENDFDTPQAIATLFEALTVANAAADGGEMDRGRALAHAIGSLLAGLGLALRGEEKADIDGETALLVRERDEARAGKNWSEADRLRDELVARGWKVEDGSAGTIIRR
ncbi:MAG: cysteine--tRNA ligase [Actinomycetota bacterium]